MGNWRLLRPASLRADPAAFSFSWPGEGRAEALARSLGRFGLLRPLLAIEGGEGPEVVAGFRRLRLLEGSDAAEVPVRFVRPAPREELWDLLLEDQLLGGPLNPVELGLYARKRTRATGEDLQMLSARVSARVGLPDRTGALEDPLWIAGLSDRLKDAFAEGRLPAQGVRVLTRAPAEDALAVLEFLEQVRLGLNKFTEVARLILECAWREGIGAAEWLRREGLASGPGDPERLRRDVRRRRFPTLAGWEETFREDVAVARLSGGVQLSHPQGFEGGRLSCTLSFSSLAELRALLAGVGGALEEGRLDPLAKYLP